MKQGFTLVEIMIVVAIIGMLAVIGIPAALGAYKVSQESVRAINISEVEKAKCILMLPKDTVQGAMGLADTQADLMSPEIFTNLIKALGVKDLAALRVGETDIMIGSLTQRATYN